MKRLVKSKHLVSVWEFNRIRTLPLEELAQQLRDRNYGRGLGYAMQTVPKESGWELDPEILRIRKAEREGRRHSYNRMSLCVNKGTETGHSSGGFVKPQLFSYLSLWAPRGPSLSHPLLPGGSPGNKSGT